MGELAFTPYFALIFLPSQHDLNSSIVDILESLQLSVQVNTWNKLYDKEGVLERETLKFLFLPYRNFPKFFVLLLWLTTTPGEFRNAHECWYWQLLHLSRKTRFRAQSFSFWTVSLRNCCRFENSAHQQRRNSVTTLSGQKRKPNESFVFWWMHKL